MPSLLYLLRVAEIQTEALYARLAFPPRRPLLFTAAFGLLSFPHIASLAPLDRRSEDVRVLPVITELKLGNINGGIYFRLILWNVPTTPRLKIDQKPSIILTSSMVNDAMRIFAVKPLIPRPS
jgi:hypothetical protein